MSNNIEVTLTAQQEELFLSEYIPKWRDEIGESVARADRAIAEKWAIEAYLATGKQQGKVIPPPTEFVWAESPLSMGAAIYVYQVLDGTLEYAAAPVYENEFLGVSVETRRIINDYFKRRFPTHRAAFLARNERIPNLDEFVATAVYRAAAQVSSDSFHGSMDADWLCFYDFLENEFQIKDEIAAQLAQGHIARHSGWWVPFEEVCFMSERPHVIARDDRRTFHHREGPAIGYTDDFGYYAWHGMNIPATYITQRDHISTDLVFAEQNAELRRALVEIWGEDKFLEALGVDAVHRDEFGALYAFSLEPGVDNEALRTSVVKGTYRNSWDQDDLGVVFAVRVVDPSTDRTYMLQVPSQDDDGNLICEAKQAVAWTFGMKAAEYMPLQQA